MPRSTLYVNLLKKLIEAANQEDQEEFNKVSEEIRNHLQDLSDEERFDLEMNLEIERKHYEEGSN